MTILNKANQITNLTALRGIAALLVAAYHFNQYVLPIADSQWTLAHLRGYLWADFFFILSGFIMTYVYQKRFETGVTIPSFFTFMRLRFARLYPVHLLTLIWLILLYLIVVKLCHVTLEPALKSVFNPSSIGLHLLMLHGFNTVWSTTWNIPAWAIGSEWLMYLLFALIIFLMHKIRELATKLAIIFILCAYFYVTTPMSDVYLANTWLQHLPYSIDHYVFPLNFVRCFAGFLLGIITHYFYALKSAKNVLKRDELFVFLVLIFFVFCHFSMPDMLTVLVFPLMILSAVYNENRVSKYLENKYLQAFGAWSYSIYMIHIPLLFSLMSVQLIYPNLALPKPTTYHFSGTIICILFLGLVLFFARLIHVYFEEPARKFIIINNIKFGRKN
jgi:peptidoglycan/LPS O-acetylase OafA/YrhL